jgi:hypothetical protein
MINTTSRKQPLTANLLKPPSCQIPWRYAHGFYSQLDAGSLGSVDPSLGQEQVKTCKDSASGARSLMCHNEENDRRTRCFLFKAVKPAKSICDKDTPWSGLLQIRDLTEIQEIYCNT